MYSTSDYSVKVLSNTTPKTQDLASNAQLSEFFVLHRLIETTSGLENRKNVLRQLEQIVQDWTKEISMKREKLSEEEALQCSAKLFTYGSYFLGVIGPDSDIDTICVGPKFINKDDFFSELKTRLENNSLVKDLVAIQQAAAPIMTFTFCNAKIDLQYAQYPSSRIPKVIAELPNGADEKTVRAINGIRANRAILDIVPNKNEFKMALRFIKYFSKRRGIDLNVLGYLGGIAMAILTAYVCLSYPYGNGSVIVQKLFFLFGTQWVWRNPVVLAPFREGWHASGREVMSIITPVEPTQNATAKTTSSTLRLMIQEFSRAHSIMTEGLNAYRTSEERGHGNTEILSEMWETIAQPTDFFSRYKSYLQIIFLSSSQESRKKYVGKVRASIHFLVKALEQTRVYAYPFPGEYPDPTIQIHNYSFFLGLEPLKEERRKTNITAAVQEWKRRPVPTPNADAKFLPADCELRIKLLKRKKNELPDWLVGSNGYQPSQAMTVKSNLVEREIKQEPLDTQLSIKKELDSKQDEDQNALVQKRHREKDDDKLDENEKLTRTKIEHAKLM